MKINHRFYSCKPPSCFVPHENIHTMLRYKIKIKTHPIQKNVFVNQLFKIINPLCIVKPAVNQYD